MLLPASATGVDDDVRAELLVSTHYRAARLPGAINSSDLPTVSRLMANSRRVRGGVNAS